MGFGNKSRRFNEQGQNLVEFALVLPLLVFMIFGALDLGRVFFATINLTNAAREGARYVTKHPSDALGAFAGTKTIAREEAFLGGIPKLAITVEVSCEHIDANGCKTGLEDGNLAEVSVSHKFELILGWLFPSIDLTRSAVMVIP
ncbi:TadE/TadG family type IV pilus assembly protein [Chloroflexota bacterium]